MHWQPAEQTATSTPKVHGGPAARLAGKPQWVRGGGGGAAGQGRPRAGQGLPATPAAAHNNMLPWGGEPTHLTLPCALPGGAGRVVVAPGRF